MKPWKPVRWLLLAGCACAAASSCDSGGQTGSETHWFTICERDADCGRDLSCVCGMCTKTGCGALVPCEAKAKCVLDGNDSPLRDSCGDEARPPSACAARCTAKSDCAQGMQCRSGVCVPPAARKRAADASAPDDAPVNGNGRNADASRPSEKDAAPDANFDWTTTCPNEMAPLGASKLADGPTGVMLSAPSGLYFGTPSATGSGILVRRLAPNGTVDMPLGNRWLPVEPVGPSALFYATSAGVEWYSPTQDRVVARWKNDRRLIPFFVGDSVEGVQFLGADGGSPFRIVTLEPSPDGGEPQATPYNAEAPELTSEPAFITGDANTLYYSVGNTIYTLSPTGQPRELATVDGSLWSLTLTPDTLFVTVWAQSNPAIHGGIIAIDRALGQQKRLVTADEIHETRFFGDSVYYTTPDGVGPCIDLRRIPAAGGVPETLATSQIFSFVFDASKLYAATFSGLYEVAP